MPNIEANEYIHVVAGVIRNQDNPQLIFITQRAKGKHLANLWEFPGGKLEKNESRFHGLSRELQEETGIQVISARPFQTVYHHYKEKKILLDVWEVLEFTGEAHGREGQQAVWVSPEELESYDFPEADQPVLKALPLPGELLISPDFPEQDLDSHIYHLSHLLLKHSYPLVMFRSHHLPDKVYAGVAHQLQFICECHGSELIISRPNLKSFQSALFKDFGRYHLNSLILQSLSSNPFDQTIKLSASCHDSAELKMANLLNVEFALLSTVRQTLSHPGREAKGWYRFKHLVREANIPVYALGGVVRKDFSLSRYQGAIGVAGISDFWTV